MCVRASVREKDSVCELDGATILAEGASRFRLVGRHCGSEKNIRNLEENGGERRTTVDF